MANKRLLFAFILALTAKANCRADFTDYYLFPRNNGGTSFSYTVTHGGYYTFPANTWSVVSNLTGWLPNGGSGSPYVTATDSQLLLDSGQPFGISGVTGDLEVVNTAPVAGFWSFDFNLTLSTPTPYAFRNGYYFINGTRFTLTEGAGSVSNIFLNAGDSFGFGVNAGRYVQGAVAEAWLTVTGFSAPVPEPQCFTLLVLGFASFGVFWRRHRTSRGR